MTKGEVCPDEVEPAQIGPPRRTCQRKCVPSGKDAMRDLPIRPVRLSSETTFTAIWGMSDEFSVVANVGVEIGKAPMELGSSL